MSGTSGASSDGTETGEEELIAFEHRSDFVFKELQKCAVGKNVHGPQFITRHRDYFFKWQLLVRPKQKRNNKLGLYLVPVDLQQNISVEFELCCGNEKRCRVHKFHKGGQSGHGYFAFLPSVKALTEKGLVVNGVVTIGVKIILNESDFDPLRWIAAPSLTPGGHIAQKLFANLIAGDRRFSDFTLVVGDSKTELFVNKVALQKVPFFEPLFGDRTGDGWKENRERTMAMPTFDVDVVTEALRLVYLNEIGDNLTRFVPALLDLANQWMMSDLKTAIERDMIKKLLSDRLNFNRAAEYFELADRYERQVLRRVAICRLIEMWPQFVNSPKGRNMQSHLKDEVIECSMSTVSGGFFI